MALRRSVRTAVRTAVLTLLLSASLCVPALTRPAAAADDADLAYRWAPIHYQDTSSAYYSADYLAPVDYDGDWNTLNNWEDLPTHTSGLTGTVYYSIVETGTHWFIVYAFFHPRDWKDYPSCSSRTRTTWRDWSRWSARTAARTARLRRP